MDDNNKKKVLLIYTKNMEIYHIIANAITLLSNKNIEFVSIVDPSRNELEDLIESHNFFCIIPLVQRMYNDNYQKYDVLKVLLNLNVEYYGSEYVKSLMINDKFAFLKSSKMGHQFQVVARNRNINYNSINFPVRIILTQECNVIKSLRITNESSCKNAICEIFNSNDNIDELILQQDFEYDYEIVITIIGTPPFSFEYINVYVSGELIRCDYQQDPLILKIIQKSYELFNSEKLRDYAQFKYEYDSHSGHFYLIDINMTNLLNDEIIRSFKYQYSVDTHKIIYTFILAYITRVNPQVDFSEIIKEIFYILPSEVMDHYISTKYKKNALIPYDYKDICKDLNRQFLKPNESNKFELISILRNALTSIPEIKNQYVPFLGEKKYKYDFLNQYIKIPSQPQNPNKVLKDSLQIFNGQFRWQVPTTLYNIRPPIMFNTVIASAVTNLYNPNAMQKKTSAGLLKMEKQIICQLSDLIGWPLQNTNGFFTTGGKVCMTYAIKCGLNRCITSEQDLKKAIVITSEINHYAVESCCNQLGMSQKSCVRIPLNDEGLINFNAFKNLLKEKISNNIPIACIIFSGGNTIHCNVECIKEGVNIIDELTKNMDITYKPFVYYDLVLGWPWLFYKYYNFEQNLLNVPTHTLNKVKYTVEKMRYAYLADAVGIDFHKGGFSPIANSVFIVKEKHDIAQLSGKNEREVNEPYQYTFSNSRSASSIISAWNVLQSVGIEGFQAYIANMLVVSEVFAKVLPQYGFEIIREKDTYGFAMIFWSSLPTIRVSFENLNNTEIIEENNMYLYNFSEYLLENNYCQFSVRYLAKYIKKTENAFCSVLSVLPMTMHLNVCTAETFANKLGEIKKNFDKLYLSGHSFLYGEAPSFVPK